MREGSYGGTATSQSGSALQTIRQGPEPSAPVGGVEQHLREMDDQLESAHGRLALLAKRLEPALGPAQPTGEAAGKNQHIGSPVAEKLRGQCMGVASLTAQINSLLERIDL